MLYKFASEIGHGVGKDLGQEPQTTEELRDVLSEDAFNRSLSSALKSELVDSE